MDTDDPRNKGPDRILTAVGSFDGHDVSVLSLNRALLAVKSPVEVIYLGYNMTGDQIATAAVQEGADAVAVASYNGGHLEFYPHLVKRLRELGGEGVLVFGGGGGTILPEDAARIESEGVEKIYGTGWSLDGIAEDLISRVRERKKTRGKRPQAASSAAMGAAGEIKALSDLLSLAEAARPFRGASENENTSKVVAVAGGGGAGKSTLVDELVGRFLKSFPGRRLAVLANDPASGQGAPGSALLADRVRMNHIGYSDVFVRSVSSGAPYVAVSPALPSMVDVLRGAGFDLVLVETPGTGQAGVDPKALGADFLLYVKTREYGGGLQLEKDRLLHEADLVVLNKLDLEGSEAAFKEMRSVLERQGRGERLYGVMAKAARDPGTDRLFAALVHRLGWPPVAAPPPEDVFGQAARAPLIPRVRRNYLARIARCVRDYDAWSSEQLARIRQNPGRLEDLDPSARNLLETWERRWEEICEDARRSGTDPSPLTPNGLRLPGVALPDPADLGESLRFLLEEGLPGTFPFASGIHPFRPATARETTRQFAGLRGPEETNRRLHFLARGVPRPRLSIAFDGITLYGADSDDDPGSFGKIGEGGVCVDTWEDMRLILQGFSIPDISTSMTINGPAPIVLAMYFNAAIDIEEERIAREKGGELSAAEREQVRERTLRTLRGTVQADILKEVQAQNESIFQTDFALKLTGDVQAWFTEKEIRRFYSLSISGYHIGEAGATPVQELAFTLANGFTYLEYFLARGLAVDDFAPNFSFFFRVSHEAEWLAYGAVCRKIWAVALREIYGAGEKAQRLKFHTQTSGRALQAEEWQTLNPLRQTYHALLGLLANTNSLHVDSADEPMTTPGEKYVRQAALTPDYLREEAEIFVIQNLLSGSYAFRALMREVQAGILEEFDRLDQLGGVLAATEAGYQRRCIAESSARYERQRRRPPEGKAGEPVRPIIGYNVHTLPDGHRDKYPPVDEVVRPDAGDRERQLARLRDFRERHREDAPLYLQRLKEVALKGDNVFAELMETVRHATLGEMTRTLAEVGGRYRKMV